MIIHLLFKYYFDGLYSFIDSQVQFPIDLQSPHLIINNQFSKIFSLNINIQQLILVQIVYQILFLFFTKLKSNYEYQIEELEKTNVSLEIKNINNEFKEIFDLQNIKNGQNSFKEILTNYIDQEKLKCQSVKCKLKLQIIIKIEELIKDYLKRISKLNIRDQIEKVESIDTPKKKKILYLMEFNEKTQDIINLRENLEALISEYNETNNLSLNNADQYTIISKKELLDLQQSQYENNNTNINLKLIF